MDPPRKRKDTVPHEDVPIAIEMGTKASTISFDDRKLVFND
jgi:hypothetical protein